MERHFASLSIPDPNNTLEKAASFSGLPTKRSIFIEQRCQNDKDGGLTKRYSCEQIFNSHLNTRDVRISAEVKTPDEERKNLWKSTLQCIPTLYESNSPAEAKQLNIFSSLTRPNTNYFSTESAVAKGILSPPKFIANFNNHSTSDLHKPESNKSQLFPEKKEAFTDVLYDIERLPSPVVPTCNTQSRNMHEIPKECDELKRQRIEESNILKKKLRSLVGFKVQHNQGNKGNKMACWQVLFFVLLSITSVYVSSLFSREDLLKHVCNPKFDFNTVLDSLQEKVYGQPEVVAKLSQELRTLNHKSGTHVIAFVGGVGVGKSHIANILKTNMEETGYVLEYFPPVFSKYLQAYSSLHFCYCNLIVLENLKSDSIEAVVGFVRMLNAHANNKHCLLILTLINTQETDNKSLERRIDLEQSFSMVEKAFQESTLTPITIGFKAMDEKAITKCIVDAAEYTNVKLTNEDIEYIKQGLLASHTGCKGAYGKVQLFRERITKPLSKDEF